MKKNIFLTAFACVSALAVGLSVVLISHNNIKPLQASPAIQPGSITIDVNDEDIVLESNTFTAKSALGNEFTFETDGGSFFRNGGYFVLEGTLGNVSALNGITSLVFTLPEEAQELRVYYGLEYIGGKYEDSYEAKVSPDDNALFFEDYDPTFFSIKGNGENPFRFSKLVINYSCTADVPTYSINQISVRDLGIYESSDMHCLAGVSGSNLSSAFLGKRIMVYTNQGTAWLDSDSVISDFQIQYEDEVLKSVTTIVEGKNEVSFSFTYQGRLYEAAHIALYGYSSLDFVPYTASSHTYEYLRTSDDSIPSDFKVNIHGLAYLLNSSDERINTISVGLMYIPLTNAMIVSRPENSFSTIGDYKMTITALGQNFDIDFRIYDPAICNIQNIYYEERLEVNVGTTKAEFIAYISELTAYVYYYDSQPFDKVTLGADNFDIDDHTFDTGNIAVYIHIIYGNYSAYNISVYVRIDKGNVVATYTNTEGVFIGGQNITKIELYDNGYCALNPGEMSDLFTYSYDDSTNVLTVNLGFAVFEFLIDESNDTFTKYSSKQGTIIATYDADLTSLGAPDGYTYTITIYDDNTLILSVMGMDYDCAYTEDPENENIIYFTFGNGYESYSCKGTIDTAKNVVVVEEVA